jgi:hypothetical protein
MVVEGMIEEVVEDHHLIQKVNLEVEVNLIQDLIEEGSMSYIYIFLLMISYITPSFLYVVEVVPMIEEGQDMIIEGIVDIEIMIGIQDIEEEVHQNLVLIQDLNQEIEKEGIVLLVLIQKEVRVQ